MTIIFQLRVHEKDLDLNPNIWYLNMIHEKKIVPEKNIITIRNKKTLTTHWSDLNFKENSTKILEDISKINTIILSFGIVVFPVELISNSIEDMTEHCPKTKNFLEKQIERLLKNDC